MAKYKVSDFFVEIGFESQAAMKSLLKFESDVQKSAERIRKTLESAMKIPKVQGSIPVFGSAPTSTPKQRPARQPTESTSRIRPPKDPAEQHERFLSRRNQNIDTAVSNQLYSGLTRQLERMFGKRYTEVNFREPLNKLASQLKENQKATYADFRKEMNKLVDSQKKLIMKERDAMKAQRKSEWMQDRSVASFKQMVGTAVTAFTVMDQVQQAIDVGMERQRREIAAKSVYGDKTADAQSNARRIAMTYGQGYNETLRQQTSFAAGAMPSMGYEGSQKFYEQALQFATVRGLSGDEMKGVMRAFEQMASKGKIQAEELRGQLGDRMAGAFQMFAAAMGVSTQELDNMMKKGEVLSDKVLPKVGDRMEQLAKENGGLEKSLSSTNVQVGKFIYASEEARDAFWRNDFKKGYTELTASLTQLLLTHRELFQDVGDMFGDMMSGLADLVGYTDEQLAHMRGYWGKFIEFVYDNVSETAAAFLDENDGWLLFFTLFGARILGAIGMLGKFKAAATAAGEATAAAAATAAAGINTASVALSKNALFQIMIGAHLGEKLGETISTNVREALGLESRDTTISKSMQDPMTMVLKAINGDIKPEEFRQYTADPQKYWVDKGAKTSVSPEGKKPYMDADAFKFWRDDQIKNFGTFSQGGFSGASMNFTTNVRVVTPDGKLIAERVLQNRMPSFIQQHNEMQVSVAAPYPDY